MLLQGVIFRCWSIVVLRWYGDLDANATGGCSERERLLARLPMRPPGWSWVFVHRSMRGTSHGRDSPLFPQTQLDGMVTFEDYAHVG